MTSVRLASRRFLVALTATLGLVGAGLVQTTAAEAAPLAWFRYKQYSSQVLCITNIPVAYLDTGADDVRCVSAGGGRWDLIYYYG